MTVWRPQSRDLGLHISTSETFVSFTRRTTRRLKMGRPVLTRSHHTAQPALGHRVSAGDQPFTWARPGLPKTQWSAGGKTSLYRKKRTPSWGGPSWGSVQVSRGRVTYSPGCLQGEGHTQKKTKGGHHRQEAPCAMGCPHFGTVLPLCSDFMKSY